MATRPSLTAAGPTSRRRLVEAAQRGDWRAEEELVRCYEPLVQGTVWKLTLPPWCEREDLAQEARLGLLSAIRAWRPERGPFSAFAERCVRNQALLALMSASRRKHQVLNLAVSLEERAAVDSADQRRPLRLIDRLATSEDPRTDPESRLLVHEQLQGVVRALPTLTAREQTALSAVLSGESYERLAQALEATPKAASQAAYRARRKLAAALPRAA